MGGLNTCKREKADPVQISDCRKKIALNDRSFSSLANILSLSGNEARLKILYLIHEEKELCPCDLSDILEMTIPAISQHLRKLKEGNLIDSRREGQTIYYSIKPEHLNFLRTFFHAIHQSTANPELV